MTFQHQLALAAPITGPNEYGWFSTGALPVLPPVVVDANVLDRDLMRAARRGERTVLVNAANAGSLRLFCAQHVLDEVVKHAPKFARRVKVALPDYMRCWEEKYLPLLRLVDPRTGLLAPDEAERIALLDHGPDEWRDSDDVPTATLALQLGAVLLCTDHKPLWAVYGRGVDLGRHEKYLDLLRLGGDAAALHRIHDEEGHPLATGVNLLGAGIGALWRWSPWAVPLAGVAVWQLLRRTSPTARERATKVITEMVGQYAQLSAMMNETTAAFRSAAAPVPRWDDLALSLPPEAVLTRVCLYTLARSAASDRSAAELAKLLPRLTVAQGEAKIRATLRREPAFHQPYQGRFQVGRPGR